MKKLINILFLTAIIFSTSCENDIDNYDAPNGGIRGKYMILRLMNLFRYQCRELPVCW